MNSRYSKWVMRLTVGIVTALCAEQTRRVDSIPGRDKSGCDSKEHCIHAVETLNVSQCSYTRIQKAAGANVGRFVLIICVIFFSPNGGLVWGTISAYTILMRKLDKYVHLKRRERYGKNTLRRVLGRRSGVGVTSSGSLCH